MSAPTDVDLEAFRDSPYARELQRPWARLRFAAPIEGELAKANLKRSRGRIRAWHSTVLAVALLMVLPALLLVQSGDAAGGFAASWDRAHIDLLVALMIVNVTSRALLVVLAWSPWFERYYSRFAFPLIAICHGAWAFVCSGEVLGAHPEYLAPLVGDAFAAYFFSGILFRQALIVNLIAAAGLVLGGTYYAGEVAPILSYGTHLAINMLMAAIAGFAFERSIRTSFLEHSLVGELAARDGLTGLKNRRAFDEYLTRVWQQGLRDRRAIGILMVDVDQFKHYNDCYGHQAGDQALRRIAAVIAGVTRRPLDIAARYGGEELSIILYDASREHVVAVAEQLLNAVRALRIVHRDSVAGVVTVSIGVAIIQPTLRRSPEGALQLADQALYNAKREGRNRVNLLEHEYETLTTGVFPTIASDG